MIRRCDGTDDNLTRPAKAGEPGRGPWSRPDRPSVPCDCGATFDDIDFMVVWPHLSVKDPRWVSPAGRPIEGL